MSDAYLLELIDERSRLYAEIEQTRLANIDRQLQIRTLNTQIRLTCPHSQVEIDRSQERATWQCVMCNLDVLYKPAFTAVRNK